MKNRLPDPKVFRLAAELKAVRYHNGCCDSIRMASQSFAPSELTLFAEIFCPRTGGYAFHEYWWARPHCFGDYHQEARLLALLLAELIAKDMRKTQRTKRK